MRLHMAGHVGALPGPSLLTNPSFATNVTSGWVYDGNTDPENSGFFTGGMLNWVGSPHYGAEVGAANFSVDVSGFAFSEAIPVVPGNEVQVDFAYFAVGGIDPAGPFLPGLGGWASKSMGGSSEWSGDPGTQETISFPSGDYYDSWRRVTINHTIPAGANFVRFRMLRLFGTDPLYVDDFYLTIT